jgi:hypothetical protein
LIEGLEQAPLASRGDDHVVLRELVEAGFGEARRRLEEAAGPLEGALLGGSLARGEGTVWRGASGVRVLSDLDFAFVAKDAAARDRAKAVAPYVARGLERRLAEGHGLAGPVDLGVYAEEDLPRQSPRPGTLEFRRSARVLYGPKDLATGFPAVAEQDVPFEEALVLLENRGVELLAAWPGAASPDDETKHLRALYAGLKAWLDGAFALLVSRGSCPATAVARQAALETLAVEGRSEALRAVLPDSSASVAFWTAMKLAPDPAGIALHLGLADGRDEVALARRAWKDGARAFLGFYRVLLAGRSGRADLPMVALAEHASHRARVRRRVRRWWETERDVEAKARAGRAAWSLRPWPSRLGLVVRGAPEHQLASCAAVLIDAWSDVAGPGAVSDWRRMMARRFPGEPPARLEWDACRSAVVRLWDTMQNSGTRTAWETEPAEQAFAAGERA